jgi:PAS domain S-box-containing protein
MTKSRKQATKKIGQHLRKNAATKASLRLAASVELSDDAIIGTDLNGIITTWNNGAKRLSGHPADEVIGKPISVLLLADRADDLTEVMRKIKHGVVVEHFETAWQKKDGSRVDVSLTVSPIIGAGSELLERQ